MYEMVHVDSQNVKVFGHDIGLGVCEVDGDLDAMLPCEYTTLDAKPVVTCTHESIVSHVDSQPELYTIKRKIAEASLSYAETPNKCARERTKYSSHVTSMDKMRVGCPFYKKNPKKHQKGSCRGIGFAEMGKLKDHLKCVHQLPESIYKHKLNFKERKFTSLKGIERKWKLVFQILFPEVPKDKIPSPCSNGDIINSVPSSNELEALRDSFKNIILDRYRVEILCEIPTLEIEFNILFNQAVDAWRNGSASKIYGFSTAENTTNATKVDILAENHHDLPAPLAARQTTSHLNGLAMSPNLTAEDLCNPIPPPGEHMGSKSQDDFDVKPNLYELLEVCNITPRPGPSSASEQQQHVSNESKIDVSSWSTPAFGREAQTAYDFDLSMPFSCGSPYMFYANLPPASDIPVDVNYNSEPSKMAAGLPPARPSMGVESVDTPFMGFDTPENQNLVYFSILDTPGVPSPPSNGMQTNKQEFDIDEWLHLDSYTPCCECPEEQM